MAKVVFFVTDQQLAVLRQAKADGSCSRRALRAFYTLMRKGLIDGHCSAAKLTKLGVRTLSVIEAVLAQASGPEKGGP